MPRVIVIITLSFLFRAKISAQVYLYSDGSSNNYSISYNKIEYFPVKKQNSSGGSYSGGRAITVSIKPADFELLKSLLERGIKTGEFKTKERMMGAVVIHKSDKAGTEMVLKSDSPVKDSLEKKLKELIK